MITIVVVIDASSHTANTRDWLRWANRNTLHTICEGLDESLLAIGVEGALREGVEVGSVDDVDVEAVV